MPGKKKATEPAIRVTYQGAEHTLRLQQFTGEEDLALYRQIGIGVMDIIAAESIQLFMVAGLLWLALRRGDPLLDYETVAKSVNVEAYTSVKTVAVEVENPEA